MSKIVIYENWYGYAKPEYGKKAKLWYTDTDSFIVCITTEDVYEDFAGDAETRINTLNCKVKRPLPIV